MLNAVQMYAQYDIRKSIKGYKKKKRIDLNEIILY